MRKITKKTKAVPRSGCKRTSRTGSKVNVIEYKYIFDLGKSEENILLNARVSVTFINSDGWKVKPLICIHRAGEGITCKYFNPTSAINNRRLIPYKIKLKSRIVSFLRIVKMKKNVKPIAIYTRCLDNIILLVPSE